MEDLVAAVLIIVAFAGGLVLGFEFGAKSKKVAPAIPHKRFKKNDGEE